MNKIACMIVTYNRRNLLKRCLDALDNQTYKDFDILVLNNGCIDDTLQYLQERQKITDKNLIVVTVETNRGMAYGYNRGYAAVFERGYDWIWTMDDDGIPANDQLEHLIEAHKQTGLLYLNALVCDIDNIDRLSFDPNHTVKEMQRSPYLYGTVNPDNGTFINKDVFYKAGNILSELFSYGMENEYVCRVKEHGFQVATVTNAIQYHPAKYNLTKKALPGLKWEILEPETMGYERYSIYVRNYSYIHNKYFSKKGLYADFFVNVLGLLIRGKFRYLICFIHNFSKGSRGLLSEI